MTERSIRTGCHGRYLLIPPAHAAPAPMLVGFHGYAEDAETQLERLRAIPGSGGWLTVSIQALNRFYQSRTNRVVANWMTRQDREAAIADNIAYVAACVAEVEMAWPAAPHTVFAGFSQGAAMAFRAAAHSTRRVAGLIAVGGDVPPELEAGALRQIEAALIIRGRTDHLYSPQQYLADKERLTGYGVSTLGMELDAGHEWSGAVTRAASLFLEARHPIAERRPQF